MGDDVPDARPNTSISPFRARRMGMKLTAPQSLSRMAYRFSVCAEGEGVAEAEAETETEGVAAEPKADTDTVSSEQTANREIHMALLACLID